MPSIASDATKKANAFTAAISADIKVDADGNSTGPVDLTGDALDKIAEKTIAGMRRKGVKISEDEKDRMKKEIAESIAKKVEENKAKVDKK